MTEAVPYLIAHKVRGAPAFDIAERVICSVCQGTCLKQVGIEEGFECNNCDVGYIWIIPTSGHRAYPYRHWHMDDLYDGSDMDMPQPQYVLDNVDPPDSLPDHYAAGPAPRGTGLLTNLAERLGLVTRPTIARR